MFTFQCTFSFFFLYVYLLLFDKNEVITASLLWSCKKELTATDLSKIHSFAKKGAEFLSQLGFSERFCRICEGVNRYSGLEPREKESDILELTDQFGGMLKNNDCLHMSGHTGSISGLAKAYNEMQSKSSIEGIKTARYLYENIQLAKENRNKEDIEPSGEVTLDSTKLVKEIQDDMTR